MFYQNKLKKRLSTFIRSFGTFTKQLDEDLCGSKPHTTTSPNNICASIFKGSVNFFIVLDTRESVKI